MKLRRFIITAVFIALAAFLATSLVYHALDDSMINQDMLYVDVIVSDGNLIGFDVNQSALRFGHVPVGGQSRKSIIFENTHPYKVKIVPYSAGNITQFLIPGTYDLVLDTHESYNLSIFLSIPPGTKPGFYEGYLAFRYFKEPMWG